MMRITNGNKALMAGLISGVLAFNFSENSMAQETSQTDPEKLFERAMAEREGGDLEEAIKAFQTILSNQPTLNRARLELAVAYFQALNFSEARKLAEQVLKDPSTPEGVKVKIREFLSGIAAASPRHVWTPSISVGYLTDSNVNAGPSSDTFTIGAATGTLQPGALKQSDHALTMTAGIAHRYLSPESIKIGGRDAAFIWQSQAIYYRTDYAAQNGFDLDVLSLNTGPGWIAARKWRANINLQADNVRLGNSAYAVFYGITPTLTGIFNNGKTEITGDLQTQRRNYLRLSEDGRNSRYNSLGVNIGHLLAGDKISIQGGVRLFDEQADFTYFSNQGNELFLGANWQISKEANIYARASQKQTHFKGDDPAFLIKRDDRENRYVLGGDYTFAASLLKSWTLSGSYSHTDNSANISVYQYDRDQVSVSLNRSF